MVGVGDGGWFSKVAAGVAVAIVFVLAADFFSPLESKTAASAPIANRPNAPTMIEAMKTLFCPPPPLGGVGVRTSGFVRRGVCNMMVGGGPGATGSTGGGGAGRGGGGGSALTAWLKAAARARALCGRASRFFASVCKTTASTAAEMVGLTFRNGGGG